MFCCFPKWENQAAFAQLFGPDVGRFSQHNTPSGKCKSLFLLFRGMSCDVEVEDYPNKLLQMGPVKCQDAGSITPKGGSMVLSVGIPADTRELTQHFSRSCHCDCEGQSAFSLMALKCSLKKN
jgi:hypothetical protein